MDRLTRLERRIEGRVARVDMYDMDANPYAGHPCDWYFTGANEPEHDERLAHAQFVLAMLDAVINDRWEGDVE